jgi:hypothetical protein
MKPGRPEPDPPAGGEQSFLTPEEVAARYRGQISTGTLANWRTQKIGPSFIKVGGKVVLYPLAELQEWDKQNLVECGSSKAHNDRR